MAYFSILTMTLNCFLMIGARRNYMIDILGGFFFAHYFWILAESISHFIDVKIFRQKI